MKQFTMTNAVIETRKRSRLKKLGRFLFESVGWVLFFGLILSLLFIGPDLEAEIIQWKTG